MGRNVPRSTQRDVSLRPMMRRFAIPFSLTLLALLGLIVAPLAGVLL